MAVVQWPCSKEQALSQSPTSVNRGNGHEKHAPVGLNVDGWTYRDLMQFTLAWAGVYQITKAKLWLQDTGAVHVTFGGSPRVTVQRITGSWNENGGLEGDWWTTATTVWPGPGTAGGGIDSVNLPSNADKWGSIDITSIVEQWAPATVKRSDGTPGGAVANYGVRLISFNEAGTASTVEFYSRHIDAAYRHPYIELTYLDNAPPDAPTVTSPVGSTSPEFIGTTSGTRDTTAYLFSDPNAGDTNAKVQVQYYGAGATDGSPGTAIADSTPVTPTSAGALNSFTVTVGTGNFGDPPLPAQTAMRKRLRTQDQKGLWGAWTSLANGYIQTAYKPGVPANPSMGTDPNGPPHIFGTLNGPGTISGWEGNFYRDTPQGRITLWASGMIDIGGGTRSDVLYAGTTLNDADVVKWTHRHRNQDGVVGPFSSEYTTTMHTLVGPSITPSSNATKLLSRTAQITITFDVSSDGYQWRLYRAGALIYDSGLVTIGAAASVNVNLPAGIVNWGDNLEIEAADRAGGAVALGPFSPRSTLHVNALPSTTLTVSN